MKPVSHYSRRVRIIKYAITGLIALLVALLFVFPVLQVDDKKLNIPVTILGQIETILSSDKPKMVKPHFQGVDKDGQPFNIYAEYAIKESEDLIFLHRPNADFRSESQKWLTLTADQGLYRVKERTLDLVDHITLFTSDQEEFYAKNMHISLDNQSADTILPVSGKTPYGTINSAYFKARERGDYFYFGGGVKVILYPKNDEEKP